MTHEEIESRLAALEATARELSLQMGNAAASIAGLMFHEGFITKEKLEEVIALNDVLRVKLGDNDLLVPGPVIPIDDQGNPL